MSQWIGKRVLIIGLGLSGCSAAEFLLAHGARVVGIDSNQSLIDKDPAIAQLCQNGLQALCKIPLDGVKDFDCVVVSPGVPHSNSYYKEALDANVEVIGEIELICRGISKKCFGVTGTNGKTTVTLLITHLLNNAGIKAKALGNIGVSLNSSSIGDDTEVFVIELSSFQLETLKSPFLEGAVLLNITPDHLDRYESMETYALAKISIERCLKPNGSLFVQEKCLQEYGPLFHCKNHTTYDRVNLDNTNLKAPHDMENAMAAYSICHSLGVSNESFFHGLSTFKKPPHRIEFICNYLGVDYYDDSKGTNIDAVIRAVDSMKGGVILIAGGVDKGFSYTPWLKAFNGKVKSICAIGQSAVKIKNELNHSISVYLCETLEKAVIHGTQLAASGDVVLLSPGCSSFDMFNNYSHRGQEFQRIVHALKPKENLI